MEVSDIITDRADKYGPHTELHEDVGLVWAGIISAALGIDIQPLDAHTVELCLAGLKLVRASSKPGLEDNYDDTIGYTTLAKESALASTESPKNTQLNYQEYQVLISLRDGVKDLGLNRRERGVVIGSLVDKGFLYRSRVTDGMYITRAGKAALREAE